MSSSGISIGATLMASLLVPVLSTTKYNRPDTTQEQFMKDRWECIQQQQAQAITTGHISSDTRGQISGFQGSRLVLSRPLFINCMAMKGYTVDKHGTLFPPKELIIPMSN